MRYVEAGGVRVSAIGLGTWQFGSREWGYGNDYAEHEAVAITERAIDLGINLIDTAEIYAFGRSERIVGRAIKGRRDEVFIATKVFPIMPLSSIVQQRGLASADRLGVDRIDLYQVHWPNPVVPLATTMNGMARLQRTGVVAHVGVSNFGLGKWHEAERALGGPVLSNQVQFSLVARDPDRDVVPWAQANDRIVIAYSPLGQGFLSAKWDGSTRPGGVRSGNALFLPENVERGAELLNALRDIAKAHDATPAQIALAWLIHKPNVVAIPGASSVAQLEANAAAADIDLTEDEFERLTSASDRFRPISGPAAMPGLFRSRFARSTRG
jgi:aryl-alcohol dehydrogenase-like predicted oxidoreductase